jgi:large subunit ribosomal protein L2
MKVSCLEKNTQWGKWWKGTIGDSATLDKLPLGSTIHNIESKPRKGGRFVRASGTYATLLAKEKHIVTVKLPSGKICCLNNQCKATIGQVGNDVVANVVSGKAGRNRWLGRRPKVRGVAKNPNDHPHGGGEGRSPVGRISPVTPWGKPTLGVKTRRKVF